MEYLLGSLSEPERSRLEEEFFTNDARFEEFKIAEDELIDAYVRNELSADERKNFRAKLMTSPRIVERVNFARAFAARPPVPVRQVQEVDREVEPQDNPAPKPKPGWWEKYFVSQPAFRAAVAFGVVLVILGGAALFTAWQRRAESIRLASEREAVQRQKDELAKQSTEQQAKIEQLTAELQRQRDELAAVRQQMEDQQRNQKPAEGTSLGSIVPLFLLPGGTRSIGEGNSDLPLGRDRSTALLKLGLERNEYPRYNVTVKRPGGRVAFRQTGVRPRKTHDGDVLHVYVPARKLPADDYTTYVNGISPSGQSEGVGTYKFRVLKEPQ
jgi:hypothetical protein